MQKTPHAPIIRHAEHGCQRKGINNQDKQLHNVTHIYNNKHMKILKDNAEIAKNIQTMKKRQDHGKNEDARRIIEHDT